MDIYYKKYLKYKTKYIELRDQIASGGKNSANQKKTKKKTHTPTNTSIFRDTTTKQIISINICYEEGPLSKIISEQRKVPQCFKDIHHTITEKIKII